MLSLHELTRQACGFYNNHVMRVTDFLQDVAERTRVSLPNGYRDLKSRRRGSLIQFWYYKPQIHYEV